MTKGEELAAEVKAWRGPVSAKKAAALIGVPWRTLEYIEAGNGFRYPELLRIAMTIIDPRFEETKRKGEKNA